MNDVLKQFEKGNEDAWLILDLDDMSACSALTCCLSEADALKNPVAFEAVERSAMPMRRSRSRNGLTSFGGSARTLASRWDDSIDNSNPSLRNEQWSVMVVSSQLMRLPKGGETGRRKPISVQALEVSANSAPVRLFGSSPNLRGFNPQPECKRASSARNLLKPEPAASSSSNLGRRQRRRENRRKPKDALQARSNSSSSILVGTPEQSEDQEPVRRSSSPNLIHIQSARRVSPDKPIPSRVRTLAVDEHEQEPRAGFRRTKTFSAGNLQEMRPRRLRLSNSSSNLTQLRRSSSKALSDASNSSAGNLQENRPRRLRLSNSSSSLTQLRRHTGIQRKVSSSKILNEATMSRLRNSMPNLSNEDWSPTESSSKRRLRRGAYPAPRLEKKDVSPFKIERKASSEQKRHPTIVAKKNMFASFTNDMHSILCESVHSNPMTNKAA